MATASGSCRRRPWPSIPQELLGLVLARLPSHADRVRLSAVCPGWRSSARLQRPLPALLPLLSLRDGAILSLADGAVHRLPVPGDVLCRVSTGSALFLVHADGSRSLTGLPSSVTARAVVPEYFSFERRSLHQYLAHNIRKAVVSDHLAAVLIKSKVRRSGSVIMSTRRRQGRSTNCSPMWWLPNEKNKVIADIAIFKGELYVLTTGRELLALSYRRRWETAKCCIPGQDHEYPTVKRNELSVCHRRHCRETQESGSRLAGLRSSRPQT